MDILRPVRMLIVGDVKGLEVVTCAYLSQDAVLMQEVRDGVDFHELNRIRFKLPSRVVAKRFKFKLIYGASAWGYAHDSDFMSVGLSADEWQAVIDEYYGKYRGVKGWHGEIVQNAIQTGRYETPTGRVYLYPSRDVASRLWFWRPKILNYPVQGLGADLVMIARISFWNRLKALSFHDFVLPVSSVHDSIVIDLDNSPELCYTIGKMLKESVEAVPENFKRLFGVEFNLPLTAEIKMGMNLKQTEKLDC